MFSLPTSTHLWAFSLWLATPTSFVQYRHSSPQNMSKPLALTSALMFRLISWSLSVCGASGCFDVSRSVWKLLKLYSKSCVKVSPRSHPHLVSFVLLMSFCLSQCVDFHYILPFYTLTSPVVDGAHPNSHKTRAGYIPDCAAVHHRVKCRNTPTLSYLLYGQYSVGVTNYICRRASLFLDR